MEHQDEFQYFHNPKKEKKTAIALEYEPGDTAPRVIASGQGYLADKILDVAQQQDIPVHKDEKLAKSLKEIEIGEYIPPELYQVVADVLVFVDAMDKIKNKVMDHGKF
jgi:flagellar biosynthesis protein